MRRKTKVNFTAIHFLRDSFYTNTIINLLLIALLLILHCYLRLMAIPQVPNPQSLFPNPHSLFPNQLHHSHTAKI